MPKATYALAHWTAEQRGNYWYFFDTVADAITEGELDPQIGKLQEENSVVLKRK